MEEQVLLPIRASAVVIVLDQSSQRAANGRLCEPSRVALKGMRPGDAFIQDRAYHPTGASKLSEKQVVQTRPADRYQRQEAMRPSCRNNSGI
jgi:hypothetical protein